MGNLCVCVCVCVCASTQFWINLRADALLQFPHKGSLALGQWYFVTLATFEVIMTVQAVENLV